MRTFRRSEVRPGGPWKVVVLPPWEPQGAAPMSTRPRKIPSYRLHKPTGQAVVRLNGRDHYLGKHGSEASHEAYERLIGEWLATGQHRPPANAPASPDAPVALTINNLVKAFRNFAERHYRGPDGKP